MRHALVACAAALLLAACGNPETRFTAEAAFDAAGKVQAHGEAGLPDGAQLNLSLEPTGGGEPITVALPRVKGGRWSDTLDPRRKLAAGSYLLRVMFSPRAFAWSPAVKPAVGENGEKLGGPHVTQGDGYVFLEHVQPLTLR